MKQHKIFPLKTSFCYFRLSFIYTIRQAAFSMLSAASHVPLFYVILFCKYQDQKQEIKARLCMDLLNDRSVVEQQYATATNLQTRISIKNETFDVVIANMMLYHVPDLAKGLAEVRHVLKKGGFFYCATYGEHGMVEYLSKILSVPENDTNKNFTLQNGSEILHKTFSNVQKLEYTDSLSVTNIDDMIEYLYSLSSMTSITGIPKQAIKDILIAHSANGILNVPKEYGMFIAS